MATEKFKNLVHFVVASCEDPQRLGATRLNKILWFADAAAYRLNGVSISGETYVKRKRGPVPKSILHAIRELEAEERIHVRDKTFPGYKMRLFVALKDADTAAFSEQEMEIVRGIAQEICDVHSANSISDLSHDQIWLAANDGEEIPLHAVLAANSGELTEEVMAWGDAVVEAAKGAQHQAA